MDDGDVVDRNAEPLGDELGVFGWLLSIIYFTPIRTAIICRVRLTTAPADCPLICLKAACGRPRMSVMPMPVICFAGHL